jgi:DNA adenine methylase
MKLRKTDDPTLPANRPANGRNEESVTCTEHKWVVIGTAIREICLVLQCIHCGVQGTIDDPDEQEWREALDGQYEWPDGLRVQFRSTNPIQSCAEVATGRGAAASLSRPTPAATHDPSRCPDCGCAEGQFHQRGCHVEECSVCHKQVDECGGCKNHDRRLSAWTVRPITDSETVPDYSPRPRQLESKKKPRRVMPAKSLMRYAGGKQGMLRHILPRLARMILDIGPDAEYREPFLGGGAVAMAILKEHPGRPGWLNDADPAVANLWDCVIHRPHSLKMVVDEFIHVLDADSFYFFQRKLKSIRTPDDLAEYDSSWIAFIKLATQQLSYSGLGTRAGGPMGGQHQSKPYSIGSRYNPARLRCTIDEFRSILSATRLRENTCTCLSFERLFAPGEAVLYLDPPYVKAGPDLYQMSFAQADHERLAGLLKQESRPWLLSYDDHVLVRELYQGWSQIEEVPMRCSINGSRPQIELLISSL